MDRHETGTPTTTGVEIAGMGVLTAIGADLESTWENLAAGRSGITTLPGYHYRGKPTAVGLCPRARVASDLAARGIELDEVDETPPLALALHVVHQAREAAGASLAGPATGVYCGTNIGNNTFVVAQCERIYARRERASIRSIFQSTHGHLASELAIRFGIEGPNHTLASSCAAGLQALSTALVDLRAGVVEAAVVVGVDSAMSTPLLDAWNSVRLLGHADDPARAARPFCRTRNGLVYAEGAACLLLRRSRRDRPLRFLGEGRTCDSGSQHGQTASGMARCMEQALRAAEMRPAEVDLVQASATGSRLGDPLEAEAIAAVFAKERPPVHSTKAIYGNAGGAKGLIDLVLTLLMLEHGVLPANPHIVEPDPAITALIDCTYRGGPRPLRTALVNTFGFGGVNHCVVVAREEGHG